MTQDLGLRIGGKSLCLVLSLSAALLPSAFAAPFQSDQAGGNDLEQADTAINQLWEITADLNTAVRSYHRRIDEDTAKYNSSETAADADLVGGDAAIAQDAIRKSMASRGLAAAEANGEYQPRFLGDLRNVEGLITEALHRIDATDGINRRLLLVTPVDLKNGQAGKKGSKQGQLKKAREAARVAAAKALQTLPVPLPEDNSLKEPAMEVVLTGAGRQRPASADAHQEARQDPNQEAKFASLPLRAQPGKRITLVNESWARIALTDLGRAQDRHLFYQEQWMQRGRVVLLKAQLVAVDALTSQHILIKRYPVREFAGGVDEVYGHRVYNETRFVKPPEAEPSHLEVESALAKVTGLPEELGVARQRYTNAVQNSMAQSDQRLVDRGEGPLDARLPDKVRANLYAIRGHLLRARSILTQENELRRDINKAEQGIEQLKKLAGWANQAIPTQVSPSQVSPSQVSPTQVSNDEWNQLQLKADDSIFIARRAMADSLAILPPDLSAHLAEFPALLKDGVVHMVGIRTSTKTLNALWQEVWDWDASSSRTPRARQDIQIIVSDPLTGDQLCVQRQTKYYPVDHSESLAEAYSRLGGPVAPPGEVFVPPDLFASSSGPGQ